MVDAILVQQPFHVLVVKLFTLINLQLHGSALCRFVFHQMAQRIAHGCALFTLQAHHPGILAQNVDNGEQVACATIVLDQFWVLHFHQIGLPGMIDGRADHRLAMGKAFTLRAVQDEGGIHHASRFERLVEARPALGRHPTVLGHCRSRRKDCLRPQTARLKYYILVFFMS